MTSRGRLVDLHRRRPAPDASSAARWRPFTCGRIWRTSRSPGWSPISSGSWPPIRRAPTFICDWRGCTRWPTPQMPTSCRSRWSLARSSQANPEVWFGHEPNLVPADIPPGTPRTAASKVYLQKSVDHYKTVVELAPAGLVGRIGYGWTLEQSGNKAGAIAEYRRVDRAGVAQRAERQVRPARATVLHRGGRALSDSPAGSEADAAEIAELQKRMQMLARVPRPITPIAIPLSDGATLKIDHRSGRGGAVRCRWQRPAARLDVDHRPGRVARVRCVRPRSDHVGAAVVRRVHVLGVLEERL